MALLDDVADRVARQVLEVFEVTGDEDLIDEVKNVIGASSTTLEEAYMTAVRVRRAEKRALDLLEDYVQKNLPSSDD